MSVASLDKSGVFRTAKGIEGASAFSFSKAAIEFTEINEVAFTDNAYIDFKSGTLVVKEFVETDVL